MKVGVLQFFSWPGRKGELADVYERAMSRIETMDRTGYDAVWLAEHHFNDYSVCPSINMMGTMVAARTQNLRIGTGVSLAVMYQPLRLAEEIALLDVLSGGRVNWGAGRGFDRKEFEAFGVPLDQTYERFQEAVGLVLGAWTNETVDGIEVLPKPLQTPHPPVWIAASSPEALDWSATQGHTIMMDPHGSPHRIKAKLDRYRQGLVAHGHGTEGREIPMARSTVVADTDEEAERIARRGAEWTVGSYANDKRGNVGGNTAVERSDDMVQLYVDKVIIHGSPAKVIDRLDELEEQMDLRYLLLSPLSGQTFDLFTEKVLPHCLSD